MNTVPHYITVDGVTMSIQSSLTDALETAAKLVEQGNVGTVEVWAQARLVGTVHKS